MLISIFVQFNHADISISVYAGPIAPPLPFVLIRLCT